MPKTNRRPIDYTPQFESGIFRPREVVEEEKASLEHEEGAPLAESPEDRHASDRADERPDVRTNERNQGRQRSRHSFDIYNDQLLALSEIQTALFLQTGRKPKLGELVQDALDAYIKHQRKRTDGRTDVRTNE